MTVVDLALNELRRLLKNPMSTLAVLALMVVPLIYSGSYLYANQDPYGNLKNIPVAIANADKTNTDSFSQRLVDNLLDSKQFSFVTVDTDSAKTGVADEQYVFALIVPEGFSDYFDDTSFDRSEAKPQLRVILSSISGYISQEIASQTVDAVKEELIAQVDAQLIGMLLDDIAQIRSDLQQAADGAQELADGLALINTQIPALQSGIDQLTSGSAQVSNGVATLDGYADTIRTGVDDVVKKLRSNKARLQDAINNSTLPAETKTYLLAELDKIDNLLATADAKVDGAVGQIDQLAYGASEVATGLHQVDNQMPILVDAISQASSGASELATKLADGVKQIPDLSDADRASLVNFAINPIDFDNDVLTKESSYATGLAPFFIALCAWIGAYLLLILMKPFSTKALLANLGALKIALGGWMATAIVGALQMITVFVGVCLIINLDPAHPVLLLLFMIFMSFVYLAILQLLISAFDKIGLFAGLVLMVLQLTTAGGTFPWQTMPLLSQILHVLLPMTYSLDGIRQLVFDGSSALLWRDILILLGWFVGSLALTTCAAERSKRWSANRLVKPIEMG